MTGLNLLTYSTLLHNNINSNGVVLCQAVAFYVW